MAFRLADFGAHAVAACSFQRASLSRANLFEALNWPLSRPNTMLAAVSRHFAALLILLALAAALPAGASAQAAIGALGSGVIGEQQKVIGDLTRKTDGLEKEIAAKPEDDARLVEIRLQLEDIARQLLKSGLAFRPRLAEINARLEQLGPPPAEEQPPEPDIVASRAAGSRGRKGRDQRDSGICRKPVDPHQRADRPDRRHAPRSVRQPSDQALRYQLRAGRRGRRCVRQRRRRPSPPDLHRGCVSLSSSSCARCLPRPSSRCLPQQSC